MIIPFKDHTPQIEAGVFVAPTAVIIGNVTIKAKANIWFGAVLRGDLNQIIIGERSSIQDNTVLHCNLRKATIVGDGVLVGHGAVLEGCEIGDNCLIGMNATILTNSVIGEGCVIAAGTVIREGQIIPPRSLVAGVPAQVKRPLTEEEYWRLHEGINNYQENMKHYENSI